MSSFSEFNRDAGGDIWFALNESRPLICFAGMWTNWTSVRKVREGETTMAFGAIYPKTMPVILTTLEEANIWMGAPWDEMDTGD